MTDQSTEVDVNVLIKIYNNKISSLTNQNLLLEAKLHTLTFKKANAKYSNF